MSEPMLDAAGRRRSPATLPEFHAGRPPRNKGMRYPADPPTIEEIVTVMRSAGDGVHGRRLRGLIVVRRGPVAVDDRARVSDLVRRRRCCRRRWPGARRRHGYASAGNTPSPGRSGRAISRGVVCSVAIVRQGAASAALRLLRWSKVSLLPASCQRRARRFFLLPLDLPRFGGHGVVRRLGAWSLKSS
jgi:hypothetical protein